MSVGAGSREPDFPTLDENEWAALSGTEQERLIQDTCNHLIADRRWAARQMTAHSKRDETYALLDRYGGISLVVMTTSVAVANLAAIASPGTFCISVIAAMLSVLLSGLAGVYARLAPRKHLAEARRIRKIAQQGYDALNDVLQAYWPTAPCGYAKYRHGVDVLAYWRDNKKKIMDLDGEASFASHSDSSNAT